MKNWRQFVKSLTTPVDHINLKPYATVETRCLVNFEEIYCVLLLVIRYEMKRVNLRSQSLLEASWSSVALPN